MAIKIICDLCGKETDNKFEFPLPVYEYGSEYLNNNDPRIQNAVLHNVVTRKRHLCNECMRRIAKEIDSIHFSALCKS